VSAGVRRRNNAPLRPPRQATGIPDALFAFAAMLATMAVVFFIASFVHEDLSNGDAGTDLARVFSATLLLSALLLGLLGILLLRDAPSKAGHVVTPALVGAVVGGIESWLFLNPRSPALFLAPLALLVFALRPTRRAISGVFQSGRSK
jgi:hypothetical protein